jgi:phosphoribosylformylglycinamidine synthase
MILFFKGSAHKIYAAATTKEIDKATQDKLIWLFGNAEFLNLTELSGNYKGPRKEMVTPWSTNAVEITQNMGIEGMIRIEEFIKIDSSEAAHDPMLEVLYTSLNQDLFTIDKLPEPVLYIKDINAYNKSEGLALSSEEVDYLDGVSEKIGRKLTDSEVFGFSQVNSEHCRHKIFNGQFIIDGEEKESSLFQLIKKTAKDHPNYIVSAYKDNVAFVEGPTIEQFAPKTQHTSDYFETKNIDSIISIKAETHNFPTTVEPFNGAATGAGGEIRDRLAGGKGSLPLAGTAVYMTSYSRLDKDRDWEKAMKERDWLYQTPVDILIKASDGASDFGNKFGQPLINGSVLTFEHEENGKSYGFDKVIMMAGGVGFGKKEDAQKDTPQKGDKVVILGGDNYRIGMGGGAVSSVATGEFDNNIELNAIQRSNPEMQKRAMNAIRAMQESDNNPIVSIHDHGAGGHLNCLSELLEDTGGVIDTNALPVGDPTLSDKEIAGNESQERMGLIIKPKDIETLERVAQRERSPMYTVGEATEDMRFVFKNDDTKVNAIDWKLEHMFGSSPKTVLKDNSEKESFEPITYKTENLQSYLEAVLQLEAVACKDWLTNKVDRSVTGKVATQQTCGKIQLPLNNLGVMALDYQGKKGVATAIGHAPVSALSDPIAGSQLSIAEALTNLVWAPLTNGLKGVSLSANWMWPAKNKGENKRLYDAVQSISDFACSLGINIPTGKDSLSMTQKYGDGKMVYSPGTVIISAVGEVSDINKTISPALIDKPDSSIYYIDFSQDGFHLGGSSFGQVLNKVGDTVPSILDAEYFKNTFGAIQQLINDGLVLAGHDISAGGLITTMLEMCFPTPNVGLSVDLSSMDNDIIKTLFSEKSAVLIQVENTSSVETIFNQSGVKYTKIGNVVSKRNVEFSHGSNNTSLDIDHMRDLWFRTSYLLDQKQTGEHLASSRFENYKKQGLEFNFPNSFTGKLSQFNIDKQRKTKSGVKAAIIREKGVNGDREMAYAMYLAGFDVKDVHMTDLIAGREDLSDINFIVFVGGFSNSDVLGSAKGWAGAFLYNDKAKIALDNFYKRSDTMSLGVCNGCQLMMELGLLFPTLGNKHPKMHHNESGKFESAFLNVSIPENDSVMLSSLAGSKLGVWVAHGEGKFILPDNIENYNVSMTYSHTAYPGNPNGSDSNTAAVSSEDGRHLAMMPHLERATFPWNWAHYVREESEDEVTPWIEAFVNAKNWIMNN